ncbi:MAG TPA: GNAT family N-acetyltransferase [Sphaerochaeta sp.]|nr:GNAT family N-acetyltransferase [Sphaerochaeta sp.]
MEHIRQATEQDIPYLYEISLKTTLSGLDGTEYFHDPYCVGHYYAAPYFFFEPSLCFIAVDEYNRPSGYIVGTSDTAAFKSWMNSHWLPPLKKHYANITTYKSENEEDIIRLINKGPGEGVWEHVGYPAHLHINLLDNLQGKGLGKALMLTFMEGVQKTGVEGIHLGVDGRNTRAFGFYEKMGFTKLKQPAWGAVFGLKF